MLLFRASLGDFLRPSLACLVVLSACDADNVPRRAAPTDTPATAEADQPLAERTPAQATKSHTYLRRLTRSEYVQTASAIAGTDPAILDAIAIPEDTSISGFDNSAELQGASAVLLDSYNDAATAISGAVMASAEKRSALFRCPPTGDCVRPFVVRVGRIAFRRPLSVEEVDTYVALAQSANGADGNSGITWALEAIVQSPSFIYRIEHGRVEPARVPGKVRLTGFEVATRLAFFLWGQGPDDALLSLAEQGALDTAEGVATNAEAMIDDARAPRALRRFVEQWLSLDKLKKVKRQAADYPLWSTDLAASMREETLRFTEDFLWKTDASYRDAFTATYTYIDPVVASVYGVSPPLSGGFERYDFPADSERRGLLTQPSLLTAFGNAYGTSAIQRARFIREKLLCQHLPDPPPDIPPLPPPVAGQSERVRLEMHRSNPVCAGCHTLLDPLGFGLDRFDGIGEVQTVDNRGEAISTVGNFAGAPVEAFDGAVQLAGIMAQMDAAPACLTRKLFEFAVGRASVAADVETLDTLSAAFTAQDYRFRRLVRALVSSDAFLYRVAEAP